MGELFAVILVLLACVAIALLLDVADKLQHQRNRERLRRNWDNEFKRDKGEGDG